MSDLISRQAAIDSICRTVCDNPEICDSPCAEIKVLAIMPSAEPEIIRCKDCKWYQESKHLAPNKFCFRLKDNDGNRIGYNFADDDFCSRAERRTDE